MVQGCSKVIDFQEARNRRGQVRPHVITPLTTIDTGARPIKCVASDGNIYWCKSPHNPHGKSEVVNELVASVVGRALGAPMRKWIILDVPDDLAGVMVSGDGGVTARLTEAPMFASLVLPAAIESDVIGHVDRDGNYDRFPLLIALWLICNAEDIQLLYDVADDTTVWSVDHGFWFGSHEKAWGLGEPDQLAGRPELPGIPSTIPKVHWSRAIDSVMKIPDDLTDQIAGALPGEWEIDGKLIERLAQYVYRRRDYAVSELTRYGSKKGR